MSYEAKVFNVMIASPGDVSSERAIIRDVIYEWNAVHSESRNIVLLPVGWETHSSPEMGGQAQEIINNQVLDRCDLLVGVFWTRIGTPTTEYASGTVEEIEEHIKSDKPAMLYFSSQPVALDTVEPEQYAQLRSFKESCQSRSLYESYDSRSSFKDKFYRQLQLKLNQHPLFQTTFISTPDDVVESKAPLPQLSDESRILLKEASLDRNGTVMHLRHLGGTNVQTNRKNFIESNERREVARWEAAIDELVSKDLLVERGHKGEMFEITNFGYQVADMIEL
ncbi:DUF4062 domain-containing protein [Vibrio alginolyticus]|uniref:DUF4062 domain-containing protein n=1 Tax=Vibrio alginolyticus TaxID=663 RepID=UPI00215C0460|nr:DUF4062 domain-containing protein [Vibrio alginolyticus]MCR9586355.1 DUF4062 domain-containing protein [Vibrio alginolyticus]MCR9899215.1 DUF4062 domain-containing protein [Vibrio alginolyticus]MCS0266262.1 DUF4062 domain-containing protein [Vibrio alginolyticus]MCS0270507.1 DUF4062 domain-containing protein [Vibrio alginolyticus]